jgi:hypothetical protein
MFYSFLSILGIVLIQKLGQRILDILNEKQRSNLEEGAKADPGKPGITENEFKEKGGQVIPGVPGNKGGQPIIAAQQQKEPPVILLAKAV